MEVLTCWMELSAGRGSWSTSRPDHPRCCYLGTPPGTSHSGRRPCCAGSSDGQRQEWLEILTSEREDVRRQRAIRAPHHTDPRSIQTLVRVSVTATGNTLPQEQADGVSVVPRSTSLHTHITTFNLYPPSPPPLCESPPQQTQIQTPSLTWHESPR